MARGIVIPFTADVRQLLRGMRLTEDAFDDLAKEIDDVGDEAGDAEAAFGRLGRSARSDLGRVERAADDVADELGDVENEANQSAKEFGSSFRGDPLEALEEVQSYLAEIVSTKLPGFAGAAAAAAGGAGVGAILFAYEKWKERQEEILERAQEFLSIYRDAGGAISDVTDELLAQQVIEEASAEQARIIAELAAQRGQTVSQFVTGALQGEYNTSEALAENLQRRAEIAGEMIELTEDIRRGNVDNLGVAEANLAALQGEDLVLQRQDQLLRDIGGVLGDNKKSRDLAVKAAQAETAAVDASVRAEQKLGSGGFGRKEIDDARRAAQGLGSDLDKAARRRDVTLSVNVRGASARAQRLLDQGTFD